MSGIKSRQTGLRDGAGLHFKAKGERLVGVEEGKAGDVRGGGAS